jgi:hypothetical protein
MNEEMSTLSDIHSGEQDDSAAAAQHANSSNAYGTFAGEKDNETDDGGSKDDWNKIRDEYTQSKSGLAIIKRLPPYFCWVAGGVALTVLLIVAITMYATSGSASSQSKPAATSHLAASSTVPKKVADANQPPPLTASQKSELNKLAQQQVCNTHTHMHTSVTLWNRRALVTRMSDQSMLKSL